jgi:hypothetical protein
MFFAAAAVAGAKITVLNEAPKLMVESVPTGNVQVLLTSEIYG